MVVPAMQPGSALSDSVRDMFIHGSNMDVLNNTKLGKGTFGFVEKGKYKNPKNGEWIPVAIKYTHDRHEVQHLVREAKTMFRLKGHPHCVEIYGLFDCPGNGVGVVMEFMDCKSLADLLPKRTIAYRIDHAISWLYQLASAVDYFHSKNELHRDLKLQNLLLADRYRVLKVGDFGTFTPQRDSMKSIRGTPVTMAPEIFKMEKYNSKCDIYSIGIIMWQIIARKEPYQMSDAQALLWNVAAGGKRPPEMTCSRYLSEFYKRCWHEDPKVRPTSKEVLAYFSILKRLYPRGNEALIDETTHEPARTPQPQNIVLSPSLRGHRRTGSDQSTLIFKTEDSGIVSSEDMRGGRSQSVADPGKRNRRSATVTPARDPPTMNILDCIDTKLKPPEPIHSSVTSSGIYSEHVASCHKLYDLDTALKQCLPLKHDAQVRLNQLLEERKLWEELKTLEQQRDEALKKIQQHS